MLSKQLARRWITFRSTRLAALASVALAATAALNGPARADSASWVKVAGGGSAFAQDELDREAGALLEVEAGLGTDPSHWLVVGGVLKTLTHFGNGTDLVIAQRTTTSGFSNGTWGAALDIGGFARFWGQDSTGVVATAIAGAPLGINVGLTGGVGSNGGRLFALTVGIDWARLTAHRGDGGWWRHYPLPLESAQGASGSRF